MVLSSLKKLTSSTPRGCAPTFLTIVLMTLSPPTAVLLTTFTFLLWDPFPPVRASPTLFLNFSMLAWISACDNSISAITIINIKLNNNHPIYPPGSGLDFIWPACCWFSCRIYAGIFGLGIIFESMHEQSKAVLMKEWNNIYTSKDSKFILVGNVEGYKHRAQGKHHIIYNRTYPQKKQNNLVKLARKNKTVFAAFDSNQYNYSNITNKQIMFHINLDQEEIITKENTYKITEKFFDKEDEDDQIQGHVHPVMINTAPLCRNHSILVMYPDQELPQIIGQDIVLLLLNIFKLFPNVKVGYNSIGASALVNHLHFHLIFPDDLIGIPKLPIENEQGKLWKQTSLVNPKEEINLYTVGVKIQEIDSPIAQAFVLTPIGENLQASEVASSLSFVFGIIVNEMIELCIPHNILFTENGNKIIIMMREFASEKLLYGWLEFSGIVAVDTQNEFMMKQEEIVNAKSHLRIDTKLIDALKKSISKNLQSFI